MTTAAERLAERMADRRARDVVGLKINLYTAVETSAALRAIAAVDPHVECFMVGDSYLMTHLGRASTSLPTRAEQDWFLRVLAIQLAEVATVLQTVPAPRRPLLIGDMPDGATESTSHALHAAECLAAAGADIVKIEVTSARVLPMIESLVDHGHAVLAHVGYTPQDGANRRYGDTPAEALELFRRARQLRDLGACGLVLERVSEPVNQSLCEHAALPIYSIFSGRARCGGQSLNVWDSVFIPDGGGRYFPPTASEPRSAFPAVYTASLIEERMTSLIRLTMRGDFPLSPPSRLSTRDVALLRSIDPWSEADCRHFERAELRA
jgi:ketopantoate hydroxymethyltransferase